MAKKGRKAARGRPRTGQRTVTTIRLSDDEKNAFQAAANFRGLSMASWMRDVCREAARLQIADSEKDSPI